MKKIIVLLTMLLGGLVNNYAQEYLEMIESETFSVQ